MPAAQPLQIDITIDDRERAGGLGEALSRLLHRPLAVRRLAVGDIEIGASLVIERKEAADFIASLLDGRLERQLNDLTGQARTAIIIIEGEFNARTLAGMPPQTVRQALLSIALDRHLPLLRSRDLDDTARWVLALAERETRHERPLRPYFQAQTPTGAHPAAHRRGRQTTAHDGPDAVQRIALERVPGIGAVKAQALISHFGSLRGLLLADEQTLSAVPGIGPALARVIRRTFSGA